MIDIPVTGIKMSNLPLDMKAIIGDYARDSNAHTFLSMEELKNMALDIGVDPKKLLYDAIKDIEYKRMFNERMHILEQGPVGKICDKLHLHSNSRWTVSVDGNMLMFCVKSIHPIARVLKEALPTGDIQLDRGSGSMKISVTINDHMQLFEDIGTYYAWKYSMNTCRVDHMFFDASIGFHG
jgi:hypothetical protein